MSTRPEKHKPRSGRRRLALVVLGLALACTLGWTLRVAIAERVASVLLRRAGYALRVEGLALDGFARVRAQRVELRATAPAAALTELEAREIELQLEPGSLWRGGRFVTAVRAAAVRAALDLERGDGEESGREERPEPREVLDWPDLELAELDLELREGASALRLGAARVELQAARGSARLAIQAPALALANATGGVTGALTFEAHVDGRGRLTASGAFGEHATLHAARFALREGAGFDAEVGLSTSLGALEATATSDGALLAVDGRLARVDLAGLLRALGADAAGFGGLWSARGSLAVPFDAPSTWTARLAVEAREPELAGRAFDALEGRFEARADAFAIERALVLAGANAAMVELVTVPRDADLACEFLERATVVLEADLSDAPALLGPGWSLPPDAPPHRIRARATLAGGWVHVGRARAEIGASRIDVAATRFPVGADAGAALLDPATGIDLDLRSPESEVLARLVLPAQVADELGLAGAIEGSVHLASGERGLRAAFDLSARDAHLRGVPIDAFTARARVEAGELWLERFEGRVGANAIRARGRVDLGGGLLSAVEVDADAPDLGLLARALGLSDAAGGSASVHARLDGPFASPTGQLELELRNVRAGPVDVAVLQLDARGGLDGLDVERLDVLVPLLGEVRAAGRVTATAGGSAEARLARLDVLLPHATLALARPARAAFGPAGFELDELALAGGEGGIFVHHARLGEGLCADIDLARIGVGRILRALGVPAPVPLTVDGRATLALAAARTGGLDGPIAVSLAAEAPDLSTLALPGGARARGSAALDVELAGTWRAPRGSIALTADALELDDSEGHTRLAGARGVVRARLSERVDLEEAWLAFGSAARVEASGSLGAAVDFDPLVRGDARALVDAALDLGLAIEAPDLAPLAGAVAILRRTEGSLSADLRLGGTPAQPTVAGRAALVDGGLKLATTLPALYGVEIELEFDRHAVRIERAIGAWGGGGIDLGGSIALDGPEPEFDLQARGTSLPILRSAQVSLRSDAQVRVSGPWSALLLTGTASLRDARFEQRLDVERLRTLFREQPGGGGVALLEVPPIREAPFDAMRLELEIASDTPVRVRTPLLEARVRPRLVVRGTGGAPLLAGALELEGGRIALPASKLDIARGRADFDPLDPGRARIDVLADGRASGYEVRVRVTGTTDDPLVELSSIPPATEEDLLLLLLAGRPPGARGLSIDQSRVVGEVASMVARDLAYEWFGDAGENFADRLELSAGGDVSRTGADTIEVRFRLAGPRRGAGRATYLRGERDVYDRVNMGVRFVLRVP
ncbi:MAG: translocation/assembly module TamB domain-containing protein [Planctomycetes bacterium]|nr:translocation/assembly module TamB domain-containing protein [Planctomycetota bacterium]